jgi:hypothetical protein
MIAGCAAGLMTAAGTVSAVTTAEYAKNATTGVTPLAGQGSAVIPAPGVPEPVLTLAPATPPAVDPLLLLAAGIILILVAAGGIAYRYLFPSVIDMRKTGREK